MSSGNPLPKNHERPNRTTPPLSPQDPIPDKSRVQKAVEKEDREVEPAREEKERKKQEKGPVSKKRVVVEGVKLRRKGRGRI